MDIDLIKKNLNVFHNVEVHSLVTSTFDISEDKQPFSLILALEQTKGRGSRNRSFYSGPGGIYMCIVTDFIESPQKIIMAAAVAVIEAIRKTEGKNCKIKWINDIIYKHKKVCGILVRAQTDAGGKISKTIIGIGLNYAVKNFPKEADNAITLIKKEKPLKREKLITEIVNNLYNIIKEDVVNKYRNYCINLHKKAELLPEGKVVKVLDIDENGNLKIRDNGEIRIIKYGQTSISYRYV